MGARRNVRIAVGVVAAAALGVGAATVAARDNSRSVRERLTGYEEVPALSTTGTGTFRAFIDTRDDEIDYRLTFSALEFPITQAHIHFENETNNGPIVVFLCTNLGNGPEGTQLCPGPDATSGTIEGTIVADDVLPVGNIDAGSFDELLGAIRADATYVNVHSTEFGAGEIRGQIDDD
jgi:CHRD domain